MCQYIVSSILIQGWPLCDEHEVMNVSGRYVDDTYLPSLGLNWRLYMMIDVYIYVWLFIKRTVYKHYLFCRYVYIICMYIYKNPGGRNLHWFFECIWQS